MTVPHLDYFSRIVNVHWPSKNGRVLVTVNTVTTGTDAASTPCTKPIFSPLGEAVLLDKRETCSKVTIPPHTVTVTLWFVWSNIATFPDLTNYNSVVDPDSFPVTEYAAQFARTLDFGGGFHPALDPTIYGGGANGYFPDNFSASSYAVAWNALYPPFNPIQEWLDPTGFPLGPAATQAVFATSLDVPVVIPAQTTSTFHGQYLFSIPKDFSDANELVAQVFGNGLALEGNDLTGATYHQNVSRISQLKGSPDATDDGSGIGDADYHIFTFPTGTKTFGLFINRTSHGGGG